MSMSTSIDISFSQATYLLFIMCAPFQKFSNFLEVSLCSYFFTIYKTAIVCYILCLILCCSNSHLWAIKSLLAADRNQTQRWAAEPPTIELEISMWRQGDLVDVCLARVLSFVAFFNPRYVQPQSLVFQSLHKHPTRIRHSVATKQTTFKITRPLKPFKTEFFLCSCATVDKISTDFARRTVPLL